MQRVSAGTLHAAEICKHWSVAMNGLIYLVGLVVVVIAVLSFFGLR
jgi:hypothetical protein